MTLTAELSTNASILDSKNAFETLQSHMGLARTAHPRDLFTRTYLVANKPVRMSIVGRAQAEVFERAFSHLTSADAAAPTLTLDLWDGCVTGIPYPFPLRDAQANLRQLSDGELLWSDETARYVWSEKTDAVTWFDRMSNHIVGWRSDGTHPPTHERSKPLTFLLSLWLYAYDVQVLHAGVVACNNKGIVITGGSGIGKTTTTICAVRAAFDFFGDDQVGVERVGDTFFRASRWEPFRLVALQAAQMGRPVIASRVGGLPEIIVDGETGLLVKCGDVAALASAMQTLLGNPDSTIAMGIAAHKRALSAFPWDEFVDGYEALYEKMLVGARA